MRVVRAEGSVDQRGSHGRVRGNVFMFIERPDHVRFDAMTQFGPAAILTSANGRFAFLDMRENRFIEGETCPANIARLLGIELPAEDVARFMLGSTPVIDAESQTMECEDGAYRIHLRSADGIRQELRIGVKEGDQSASPESQHLRLLSSEVIDANGHRLWRASYDDYRVVADPLSTSTPKLGVAMPFRLHFEDFRNDADILIRFESIDLNVEVSPEVFNQSAPPGVDHREALCDGDGV